MLAAVVDRGGGAVEQSRNDSESQNERPLGEGAVLLRDYLVTQRDVSHPDLQAHVFLLAGRDRSESMRVD